MSYYGTLIKESLEEDLDLGLFDAKIINTRVSPVTTDNKTPWLKQWTLLTFTVPESRASELANTLSSLIETEHSSWYVDFKSETKHFIIFPRKVFWIDRTPEQYAQVVDYGVSLGIPQAQLDFSPELK